MADAGRKQTDKELRELEKRIKNIYGNAALDVQEEIFEYFASFAKQDAELKEKLEAGEITEEYYTQWRLNQIGRGERFLDLRDKLAERMTKANETALAYVNDKTPGIYTLNRNYAAYEMESAGTGVDFTLYDESTVRRLIKEQPDLMPYYPKKKALKRGIDLEYGKKQITAHVTSGILTGGSMNRIAAALCKSITDMSAASAIRAARTAVTAAENGGRTASYKQAADRGIELTREWIATKDARTRHSHGAADGQRVGVDEPFTVGGEKLMFPGDGSLGASGKNLYNCRCSVKAMVKGHERKRETYDQWFEKKQREEASREESKNLYDSTVISPSIKTSEYRNLFNNLDEDTKIQRKAYQASKSMLEHRSGTKYEDLSFIDSTTGKTMSRADYNVESEVMPSARMRKMVTNAAPHTIIAVHNHPGSSVPSFSDLQSAYKHKYKYGLIACHNGTLMKYEVTGEIDHAYVDALLDKAQRQIYNQDNENLASSLQQLRQMNVALEIFK